MSAQPDQPTSEGVRMPSEVVQPTRSTTEPQQGATQPGTGSKVHVEPDGTKVVEVPAPHVPFKEQVIGYAKKTRGTVLNNPETKEHGEAILEGKATLHTPPAHD
ncbi:hypothetical protein K435DRAFT_962655 [Dendrothele bispora CBS 962.96]|uniref:Uncharacterized protein n=1 Tax=Dendrothele bispora (strain CBS 962.96) TaxID=1314807 RepID=A0A4S8MLB6_DENBC|nr:hypothetical protein K435DRAFT_962655 [Dendrothele bispora CBS 962.96]